MGDPWLWLQIAIGLALGRVIIWLIGKIVDKWWK